MLGLIGSHFIKGFWMYLLFALSAMIEGPLTILTSGAGIAQGLVRPGPIFLAVVAGNLVGDIGWYSLGRFAKPEWLYQISPKLGISAEKVAGLQDIVRSHTGKLIFLAKFTAGLPIPTLIAVGLSRVPKRQWAAAWIGGELVKSAIIMLAGYLFSAAVKTASGTMQAVIWSITGVLIAAGFVWYRRHKHTQA
ncbi:MAG TPA: VTT domain-containing protein [Anaerolineaceae bacterium]|jgi:membrane protein DedA with SNARE-associated domain|nr:VTT domain-containing protein [Anaerolineales bacterium]HPL43801.1 VTT domain-containing protein [Anaerolineaceae bacterium]HPY33890.1 VTT domain-containing protein [Anaerolineaceae bacterium]HQC21201.1 VTT domain-containing protein [Anaerolineaceae bacterium]